MEKNYLFTSESVSEGHPDKVADQISDAILDEFLAYDPQSKVACETLVTTGHVTVAGEVKSKAYVDLMEVTREVIKSIGYDRSELKFEAESCGVLSALHEQSPDINRGVERDDENEQGAGDQGMMFGYACNETATYMPLPLYLSHILLQELSEIRREGKEMVYTDRQGKTRSYLRPDSKSQVTVEYDSLNRPVRVHTIVISTQHDEFIRPDGTMTQEEADRKMVEKITEDVRNILIPRLKSRLTAKEAAMIDDKFILHVNPTGKFVIGGPHGDTGLTGRKIIVDTYGGRGAHGGGAFSGKDPSKVDRSAAYAARHIAKNLVAAGVARQYSRPGGLRNRRCTAGQLVRQHLRHLPSRHLRRRAVGKSGRDGRYASKCHRKAPQAAQPHLPGNRHLRPHGARTANRNEAFPFEI